MEGLILQVKIRRIKEQIRKAVIYLFMCYFGAAIVAPLFFLEIPKLNISFFIIWTTFHLIGLCTMFTLKR